MLGRSRHVGEGPPCLGGAARRPAVPPSVWAVLRFGRGSVSLARVLKQSVCVMRPSCAAVRNEQRVCKEMLVHREESRGC